MMKIIIDGIKLNTSPKLNVACLVSGTIITTNNFRYRFEKEILDFPSESNHPYTEIFRLVCSTMKDLEPMVKELLSDD